MGMLPALNESKSYQCSIGKLACTLHASQHSHSMRHNILDALCKLLSLVEIKGEPCYVKSLAHLQEATLKDPHTKRHE